MTGSPGSGTPAPTGATPPATIRDAVRAIGVVVALGLAFRLIIAYLLPGSGFGTDVSSFIAWANELAADGLYGFYERDFFVDYTPGYLYVLWLMGHVGQVLGGLGDLIKLPAILADGALAIAAWVLLRDLGVGASRARVAAIVILANPITWFDSVVWGQVDSFGVVFLLFAVRELWRGRTERAAILAVVAALIKPQLGILAPLVAAVAFRRAFWPAGADDPDVEPSGTRWERRTTGPVRIITTGVAGFVTAVAISAPFGLTVINPAPPFVDSGLVREIVATAGGYPYVTVNAYNIWALPQVTTESGVTWGLAEGGTWICDATADPETAPPGASCVAGPDTPALVIAGIPAGTIGMGAMLLVVLAVSVWVGRHPDRRTILVGLAILALAFFAVPTRVHERYLFPFVALGAILAAVSWRWAVAYAIASVATFLNMYVVLVHIYDNPGVSDWLGLGPTIRSASGVTLIALAHTAVFAWSLTEIRRRARYRLADEVVAAGEDEAAVAAAATDRAMRPVPGGHPPMSADLPVRVAAAEGRGAGLASRSANARTGTLLPAWVDRARDGRPLLDRLAARMAERPVRPDRSGELRDERGGRLDRLDAWLLVVLVIATLGLRTFRLAEPAQMHFDEVYHARTATEFLQDWRYGIDHDIYEWTHPHLAKYAIAGGIVAFAGHDVAASGDLGVPVRSAAVEPRRENDLDPAVRAGDRLWVATGTEVVGFDLETRQAVGRWAIEGAGAVTVDRANFVLLIGTDGGQVLTLDLRELDLARADGTPPTRAVPAPLAELGDPVRTLGVFDGGETVAAILEGDVVATIDVFTATEAGRTPVPGAVDLASGGRGAALTADPLGIADLDLVAMTLAELLGGDAESYRVQIEAGPPEGAVITASLDEALRTDVQAAIDDGRLAGLVISDVARIAVAGTDGLTFLGPDASVAASVFLEGGARGADLVSGIDEGTALYVTTQDLDGTPRITLVAVSGSAAENGPSTGTSFALPGPGTSVAFDSATELVHVLGRTPDGQPTSYVIEPHANAVFADHRLGFEPAAWVLDSAPLYPSANRGAILAFAPDGATASLDVGHYAFAWRLPGVLAGVAMSALLFVLARILFRRRSVAVLTGLFALVDGMLFVQSRIAMNDVYVGVCILAAYTLFAALWTGWARFRGAFWVLMPLVGVLLGLALASKWVAAYAIGALGILVLARSALGRILLILGLLAITTVLGLMAISVPEGEGVGNLGFMLIMIGLTLATVAISVLRPIAWSFEEIRFAIGAPAVLGGLLALAAIAGGAASTPITAGPLTVTPLHAAFALVVAGIGVAGLFALAARFGFGPTAPIRPGEPLADAAGAASPPPDGWLRFGSALGLPVAWLGLSLLAIPLAVYVVSYLPWAAINGHQIVTGFPAGHEGQTLAVLTQSMYSYHNDLTSAHAASSPWWAWPLNLKPVWFYQGGFANSTAASIYDAGNLIVWWLGVPAMVFATVMAYRRRSLALGLIVIGFACQWIPWARIDRAAFQYHYFTSVPFIVLGLAYLVAEVWHGASARTWRLVRIAAGLTVLGAPILWLLRLPLCVVVRVTEVNPESQACVGNPGNLEITPAVAGIVVVGVVTGLLLLRELARLSRGPGDDRAVAPRDLLPLVAIAAVGGLALALARGLESSEPLLSFPGIVPELIAMLLAIPLVLVAIPVITARDARRFVVGLVVAAAGWFVVLYPNISALPLPSPVVNAYQGILPTYLYPFQFPVTQVRAGALELSDPKVPILFVALTVAALVVAYTASSWRSVLSDEAGTGSS